MKDRDDFYPYFLYLKNLKTIRLSLDFLKRKFMNCQWPLLIILLCATACTKVPQADDCHVASLVHQRIAKRVYWSQETAEDLRVEGCIQLLLERELSVDHAVQIALLNNPHIQATFEELGIAQADL